MGGTLYRARSVRTLDERLPFATGVLVEHGVVAAVGDADGLERRADEVVDLGDAVIVPGLVDAHAHPIMGLQTAAGVDLMALTEMPDVVAALEAERERVGADGWVRAWGLNPVVFGGDVPSAAGLGEAVSQGLSHVVLYDAHSAIASSAVLALAGIDGPREFASSARIWCDGDGRPTGYLLEDDAASLVEPVLPEQTLEERAEALLALLGEMAACGYTAIQVMDCGEGSLELVRHVESFTDLPVRLEFHPMLLPGQDTLAQVIALQGERGRRWEVIGVKMMVDGTVDGGTAWLEHPDTHGEGLEPFWKDMAAFRDAVEVLHRAGVDVAVHAIGDRGVREVMDTFVDLHERFGALARHRIEHIETIPDVLVEEFGRGLVAASMQPMHCTAFNNAERTDSWSRRLGDERVDRGFRWADLREAGATLALGSDWPTAPSDARWILADARLRRHHSRPDAAPMQPEQVLTGLQALEGLTSHAARARGAEHHRGRIVPGYDADLTVFAADPVDTPAEAVATLEVVATVIAGVRVR